MNKHVKVVAGVLALTLVFSGGLAIGRANISVTEPVTASAYKSYTYGDFDYTIDGDEVGIIACNRDVKDAVIPSEIDGMPVKMIETNAFVDRTNLESVTIPDSVQTIGYDAFKNCTSLTSITVPDSVRNIARGAFEGCTSLESVNLGKNTVVIGERAFFGCTSLASIVLPDALKIVEYLAFGNCEKLSDITFPENIVRFDMGAFDNTLWLETKRAENPLVIVNNTIVDGFTCSGDVVIPDGVTNIDGYAFYGCTKLKSITIPESVETISDYAFYDSSVSVITIMNPDCNIYDSRKTLGSAIINAPENSTAQAYAEKYNLKFVALGEELPEIPDTPATIKKGDINEDGYVDPIDASIILSYYAYISTTTDSPVMDIDEYQAAQN